MLVFLQLIALGLTLYAYSRIGLTTGFIAFTILFFFLAYLIFITTWKKSSPVEVPKEVQMPTIAHLKDLWIKYAKEGFLGPLRDYPTDEEQIEVIGMKTAEVFEVETDILRYQTSHREYERPWSQASSLRFYDNPVPVAYPTDYQDEEQIYPIQSTLKRHRCEKCKGKGKIKCPRCRGRGEVSDVDGWDTCMKCHGRGKIKCKVCDGEGLLGRYKTEEWRFIHYVGQKTVGYDDEGNLTDAISDIPNSFAEELDYLNNEKYKEYFQEHRDDPIIAALESMQQELQQEIESKDNVHMYRFTFRSIPRLTADVRYKGKKYQLIARGFPPLTYSLATLPQPPIRLEKVLGILLPPVLIINLLAFL